MPLDLKNMPQRTVKCYIKPKKGWNMLCITIYNQSNIVKKWKIMKKLFFWFFTKIFKNLSKKSLAACLFGIFWKIKQQNSITGSDLSRFNHFWLNFIKQILAPFCLNSALQRFFHGSWHAAKYIRKWCSYVQFCSIEPLWFKSIHVALYIEQTKGLNLDNWMGYSKSVF